MGCVIEFVTGHYDLTSRWYFDNFPKSYLQFVKFFVTFSSTGVASLVSQGLKKKEEYYSSLSIVHRSFTLYDLPVRRCLENQFN